MARKIVIIQGHPDKAAQHFGHVLADAYAEAATQAGHKIRRVEVAQLEFPWLHGMSDWEGPMPLALTEAQAAIGWADHIVLMFPLWLGTMPAILKAFLEQVLRPGFAFDMSNASKGRWKKALTGKTARIVVTMGMPAFVYRWYFLAHGVRGLERSILKFCGISPIRETFIGMVEGSGSARGRWLEKLSALGRAGK